MGQAQRFTALTPKCTPIPPCRRQLLVRDVGVRHHPQVAQAAEGSPQLRMNPFALPSVSASGTPSWTDQGHLSSLVES